jgi:hypothetical protein
MRTPANQPQASAGALALTYCYNLAALGARMSGLTRHEVECQIVAVGAGNLVSKGQAARR